MEFTVASPLGYGLRFTTRVLEVEAPARASLRVTGDLRGVGVWSARSSRNGTEARIMWCVTSRRRSVRLFRVLAPWAHGRVMRAGERALAKELRPEN